MKKAIFILFSIFILSINLYPNDDEFVTSNEFIKACFNINIKTVKNYINNGGNIDAKDERGFTGLMYAAQGGHYELVRLLLENGADPNIKALNGSTALILASTEREISDIINILLDYGADINAIIEEIGRASCRERV